METTFQKQGRGELMTGKSHAFIGAATGFYITGEPVGAVLGGFGALLVDLDEPNSTISRFIFPPGFYSKAARFLLAILLLVVAVKFSKVHLLYLGGAVLLLAFIPHRGIFHSPFFLGGITILTIMHWGELGYLQPILAGYFSHIVFTDFLSDHGVSLWPFKGRIGLSLITTGGISEYLVVIFVMSYVAFHGI